MSYLHDHELFDLGVVLKGGTALRKVRAGNAGRFSTDLDFATTDPNAASLLLDTIDGAEHFDVSFALDQREPLRAALRVETPLGQPRIPARIEVSPRPLWLPIERRLPIFLPVHRGYEFEVPSIPVQAFEEAVAEKLAAWRRRRKLRDLYDLDFSGRGAFDEPLIRRILVLKIWQDVVDDRLGNAPFDPSEIIADFDVRRLLSEDIGLLTQPVDAPTWLARLQRRYRFVTELDDVEDRIARCNPGDRNFVEQAVAELLELRS